MKSYTSLLHIISACLFAVSCSYSELDKYETEPTKSTHTASVNKLSISMPTLSDNSLIVKYKRGLKESIKDDLRGKFKVISYKKCNCTNTYIEQWEFSPGTNIEGRKDEITQDGVGVEGVDFQFYYPNENVSPLHDPSLQSEKENMYLIKEFINVDTSEVSIALLDTGIDVGNLIDLNPRLYGTNDPSTLCQNNGEKEISGWDFVNGDPNTYDDNGHGSAVARILIQKLQEDEVFNFDILPVKIFNKQGDGDIFTTLCGYAYAVSKPDISIVNMSFGWYGYPSEILSQMITENPQIVNITSAGNTYNNNDVLMHYPSSYPHKNVLAVGSINEKKVDIASFSNYGTTSVDFLSLGEMIPITTPDGINDFISGTSFATPLVTAKSSLYFTQGYIKAEHIEEQLEIHGTVLPSSHLPVKYSDIIIE